MTVSQMADRRKYKVTVPSRHAATLRIPINTRDGYISILVGRYVFTYLRATPDTVNTIRIHESPKPDTAPNMEPSRAGQAQAAR